MLKRAFACAALTLLATACGGGSDATKPPITTDVVASVTIPEGARTLPVGGTFTFTAIARTSAGTIVGGRTVSWVSSNAAIVSVSSGVVTAVAAGVASITATIDAVTASVTVTVTSLQGSTLQLVSGNQQVGIVGRALADSLVVRVTDAIGLPVAGAAITWSATGGVLSSPTTAADASGLARVQWIVGPGQANATASMNAQSSVSFSSTGRVSGVCNILPNAANQRFSLGQTDFTLSLHATNPLKIAVLFADFPDAPGVESPNTLVSTIVTPGIQLLREMSYNRLNITTVTFPKWYRMSKTIGSYTWSTYDGHKAYITELMTLADPEIDFSTFDAVYIFAPASTAQAISPTFNGGLTSGVIFDGRNFGNAVTFGNDSRTYGAAILAHETGHMLGLVDLYAFTPAGGTYSGNQFKYVGAWSLMSNTFNPAHYLMWEKRKLGFVDADQVDCLDVAGEGEEAVVQPNATVGGLKMISIPLDASRALAIEVRSNVGLDANLCSFGVLIYEVNATIASGSGPAQVRGSRVTTSGTGFTKCGPWTDGVFGVGAGAINIYADPGGAVVTVLAAESGGAYRIRVKR